MFQREDLPLSHPHWRSLFTSHLVERLSKWETTTLSSERRNHSTLSGEVKRPEFPLALLSPVGQPLIAQALRLWPQLPHV